MRSILVLGLLIALSTSADAANMHHHSRTRHHLSPNVASSFNFAPRWGYERTAPSVNYEGLPTGPNNLGGLVGGNPNGA